MGGEDKLKKKMILYTERKGDTLSAKGIEILHDCEMVYDLEKEECTVYMDISETEHSKLKQYIKHEEDALDWVFPKT